MGNLIKKIKVNAEEALLAFTNRGEIQTSLSKILKVCSILLLAFSVSANAASVTITNNDGNRDASSSRGWVVGQSFTATKTGLLTSISFVNDGSGFGSCTLKVYEGGGTSGTVLYNEGIGELPDTLTDTHNFTLSTYTLTSNVPITNGSSYTFEISPSSCSDIGYNNTNDYAGGSLFVNGGEETGHELIFEIVQGDGNSSPTLSGLPISASVSEDVATSIDLSSVFVADADGDTVTLTLAVNSGVIASSDGNGTFSSVTVSNSGTTSMTLAGTASSINSYLDSITKINYTTASNSTSSVTLTLTPNDGTVDGSAATSTLNINAVNDEPLLTIGANQNNSGADAGVLQTVTSFASMSSPGGGSDETSQSVSLFIISEASDPNNVVSGVAISNSGTLTYTPASHVAGTATINVQVQDDGGTSNGGDDTSQVSQFTISVDTLGPVITNVSIPNSSHKVGDTVTAMITVDSSSDIYTLNTSNINGYSLGNLAKLTDITYSATFSVVDGSTDVAAGSNVAVNVTLTDSIGNTSSAYSTAISQSGDAIYANYPKISLGADTNTINEDGGVSTLSASLASSLHNQWPEDITVNLSYSGTATVTTDYTKSNSISILAGNSSGTAAVTGVADTLYDAASAETVIVDVSTVSVGTEDGTQQQTISITDAEAAPTVSLSVGSSTVAENGGTASITATLEHETYEDVTVGLSYSGSATSGIDFATPSSSITISSGTISASAATDITGSDDGDEEGAETIIIDVSSVAGGGASENGVQQQTITISDDDDTTPPVIASVSVPADNTYIAGQSLSFTVNTDEVVTVSGSPSLTLNIGGTTKSAAYASGSGSQALVFTYSVESGLVDNDGISLTALSMNANEIQDAAGNDLNIALNSVGSLTNVRVDSVAPTVTGVSASTADGQYKAGDSISLAVSFDEAVTATGSPRLLLETGTTDRYAAYTSGSGSTALIFQYTVQTGDTASDLDYASTTALELNSGTINDSNGNAADLTLASPGAANSLGANKAFVIDTTQPTVTISSNKSVLKRGETAAISFTLSESSSDFIKDDVTVVGGTLSALSGSGTSYTATFTPSEDSNVTATIDVVVGKFTDSAGNNNAAAIQEMISVDTAVPSVVISDDTTGTATGDVTYTFTFSESVTGFTADDITVSGGSKGAFTAVSSSVYTLVVTPDASSTSDITVNVAANVATDAAGNNNTAATQSTQAVDTAVPTVVITDDTTGTATGDVTYTVTFSEAVTGFAADDITVSGGSKGTFTTVSSRVYTLVVTPDASSTSDITVNVAANVATDAAGNNNTAATQSIQAVDTAVPSVVISDDITGTATGDVTYTVTFSEAVTGFAADDITVSGGSKGTFTTVSSRVYTLVVTPDASSTSDITVNVAANVATDAGGNNNTAATQSIQAVDTAVPSVVISDDITGTATGDVTYTVTFSESVTGFAADDITVSGGSKGAFTAVSSSVYTLVVTPDASSTANITVNVAANVASDAAGNNNTAATQSIQAVDTAVPSVVISDDTTGTATGDVIYTFTFSESVTGFAADDITVSGGSKGSFTAVSGSVYTLVVTPDASSTANITVNVAANVATDAAGNNNTAATQSIQAVDTAVPSVVISDDTTGMATGDVIYTFTFSEAVTGFIADDITVSGGSKGSFTAASGSVYTLVVTPDASSTSDITVNVAANVATDAAGNNNTAATQSIQAVDTAVPTVVITDDTTGTATGDVTYTFTFSESVTGFIADDITVSGGSKGAFTAVSSSVYTLVVTPDASSTANITVNVAANVVTDAAGNNNTAATQSTQAVDTAVPTVAITDDTTGTATGDVIYTVTFSEAVTGFAADDITVSGGSKGAFTAVSSSVYTLVVTPDASSTANITVNVAANVATDAAGNNNTAATQSTQPVDTAVPSVVISDDTTGTATGDVTYTVTFSESVTGFAADDITVSGGSKGSFTAVSGSVYTLVVTPDASSTANITVNVAANVATDAAGNNNTAATQSTQAVDTAVPTVVITDDTTGTATGDVIYTVTFSEAVTGFAADDITVSGGSKGTFTTVSSSVYTLVVTPDASSTSDITVNVAANVATDAAGNNNTAATQSTQAVDTAVPTVVITDDTTGTATGDVTYTFTFSESVTGFAADDITVSGGSKGSFTAVSGSVYTLVVTPDASSTANITVNVAANMASDAAGNNTTAATQSIQAVDTAVPSVVISDDTTGTATGDVTYTVTFSEPVTGFIADDITVSGGSKGSFTAASGSVYTLVVTPDASSTSDITVNVAANVATDAAGNNNTAATQSTQPVDTAVPSVVISDDTTGTATGDVTYTFTFSESVTGFAADDITVSGGSKGSFTAVSGSVYTLVVTPDASSTSDITVNVAANVATDAAGNNNIAATQSIQTVDTVLPSVTITSDKTSLKVDETATITIVLSEASSDFNIGDISVTGGELSNFVATSSTQYSVLFTPTANSETNATLDINADTFTDAAGNGNTAATQLELTVDTQAPSGHSVVIDQALINRNNEVALSFTVSGLESAGSFTYQISDGTNSVSGSSSVAIDAVSEQVTGIDVSSLAEGTLTLSVVISDEAGNAAASISATVLKKYNVAPQLSGTPASTVNEDAAYSFTPTLTDPDLGDTHTYSIENKPDWAEFDTSTGALTGTPDDVAVGNYSNVQIKVSDGTDEDTLDSFNIEVVNTNDAPVGQNFSFTLDEAATLAVATANGLLSNAADDDTDSGDTLTVSVVTGPQYGLLSLSEDGSFSYQHDGSENHSDSFTFQVVDASSARSETYTVSLAMNAVADAPVTVNDTATTNEDVAVIIKLLDNDYDPENDMVASSAAVVTQPGKGNVTIANGIATYTPTVNLNGQDSFTYTVKDAALNKSAEATVTVTIAAVNDLPVVSNQTATIDEDSVTDAIAVRAAANDVEDGKPTGEIAIATEPSMGSVSIDQTAGTLVYTPNLDEVGTDTFTYTITDSESGVSEPATVTVNIGAVNDRPVAGDDSVTTDEDVAATLAILTNDSDIEDQSFTKANITLEDQGNGAGNYAKTEVTIQDDGSLAITPRANENGTFSFTYTLTDSEGLQSEPATVTVVLTPVNDSPVAADNTAELQEEGSFEVNVLGNDTDVDTNDSFDLTSVMVVQLPANGQVQVTTQGAIVYTANANYYGDDTFTYTVKDAAGAVSNEATVTMTVTPVNDAPVATAQSQTLDEDTTLTLTLSGTDIEDDSLVYSITESTSNGKLEQLSENSWRYTPNTHFNGADSFKFKVNDGELDSEPVEVSLTVNPVNDAPSVQSLSVDGEEDKALAITLAGSDVESSSLTYQLVTQPENGSVLLSGNEVTYQADANFFGQDSFTYKANDGELDSVPATVTITIAGVNDAPMISGTPDNSVDEDTAYLFVPVGHDNDTADTLSFDIANKPSWASFDEATGALSGTPGNAHVGTSKNIVISVSDGTETASLPGFILTVNNVNDAPVISGNPATEVNEDSAYYYKPQVTDVDSTSLTFSITNKPTWASFDEATGTLSGTPDNSHVGTTSGIVISVSDGAASASLPAFNLTVKNVNDAPVGESLSINLDEDASADIEPVLSDVDSNNLTRKVVSSPSHGSLAAATNGWTYTPAANYNGSDVFEYQVSDGQASSVTYSVTLTIAAVNDDPVAVDDTFVLTANDQASYTLDVLINDTDVDEDTVLLDWVKPTSGQASLKDNKILLATTQSGTVTMQYGVVDGNGGKATAKATVTIKSDKLEVPTITAPDDVVVNATALSTKVDLGTAVAFDSTGKPLPVSLAENTTFFRPGVNTVYWQTEDSQGNVAEASQTVTVHPLVSIEKDGETTEGTLHPVKVYLNGPAPSYPVTIPYTVSGTSDSADHDLIDGEVVITKGTVGEITFNVHSGDDPEGTETLTIVLDSSLNLGSKNQYTLTIYEQNVAPKVSVTVKQGEEQRSKVENSDQAVTVTATVADPNAGDTHTYAWVAADDKLAAAIAGQTQGATLSFSPSELSSAIYHLQLTVTDSGPLSVKEDVYLEVVKALAVLGDADSDGDLIPDNQEGHTDSDNDGIPDYQDAISDCNVIQETVSDPSSYLVEGEPGVCLRKGVTVAGNETGGTQLLDTEVTTQLGEDDAADNIGGIFDFVATGLPQVGQSYRVVFPQRRPIPANAVYRKYRNKEYEGIKGWVDFVEDAENSLASAQGEAGYCPPPGDASWVAGLTEGHWCVQLTIQDGGPNDDDGTANGSVVDPGGVAARATSNTIPKAQGDTVSVSRNGHIMIDALANDSDADGHALTIANATADFGSVGVVNNWLSYTAKDQFYGVATISYSVTDNNGGTDFADVTVKVVNSQTPVAVDDEVVTDDRTSLVIRVLSNDSDPDADTLTIVSALAQNGVVSINSDQTLMYIPKVGFEGVDTITYVIRDSNGLEDTGLVKVTTKLTQSVTVENEAGGSLGGLTLALLALFGFIRRVGKRGWLVLLVLLSFNSLASWFVESDLGVSNAHERTGLEAGTVVDSDDSDFYWTVGIGYELGSDWALTVRYIDQGQGSATIRNNTATPEEYHQSVAKVSPVLASGIGIDVHYSLWKADSVYLDVSAGGMYWETDFDSTYQGNTISSSDDGVDPYLGVELGYEIDDSWTIGLGATRYFIDANDVDGFALKLKYRFSEDE